MYKPKYFNESEMRITNETPEPVKNSAYKLVEKVLDPLREFIKKPIIVNSFIRTPEYNDAVGGANGSQHTLGEASDIKVNGMAIEEIYASIIRAGIVFDQLILEYGNGTTWIHISYREGRNRKQVLKGEKINGVWKYTPIKH